MGFFLIWALAPGDTEGWRAWDVPRLLLWWSAANVFSALSVILIKMSSFKSFSEVGTTSTALGHKNNLTNWRRNVLDDWVDCPKMYFNKSSFRKQIALGLQSWAVGWSQSISRWGMTSSLSRTRLIFFFTSIRWMWRGQRKASPCVPATPPVSQSWCLCSTSDSVPTDEPFPCLLAKWAGKPPNSVKTQAQPLIQNFKQKDLFYKPLHPHPVNAEPAWEPISCVCSQTLSFCINHKC